MTFKTPQEKIQEVIKTYKKLKNIKAVAKKFKYEPATIYKKLKQGGCKLFPYKRKHKSKNDYIPTMKKKEFKSYRDYLVCEDERIKGLC